MNDTITNPLNLYLLIIGTFLGLRLTAYLWGKQSLKANSNKYLGLLILVLTFILLPALLFRFELLKHVPHFIGLNNMGPFLIGPLTYLYVRACTEKGFKLRSQMWIHFVPFFLEVIMLYPFWISTGAEKYAIFLDFMQNGTLLNSRLLIPIKAIHGLAYFGLSIFMILKYKDHLSDTTSTIDHAFHRWLNLFVFIVALPIFALLYYVVMDFDRSTIFTTFLIMYLICFLAIDMAILVKPGLFQIYPHQALISGSSELKQQKYESSHLSTSLKDKYLEKLENHLKTQQSYKEPELSLGQLSNQLDVPSHYLSQVINEKLGTNFLDLINQYRVEDVKLEFANQDKDHLTIMAIAFDSGFNSKSAFYTAFKKHAGMTPSEYRKQVEIAIV